MNAHSLTGCRLAGYIPDDVRRRNTHPPEDPVLVVEAWRRDGGDQELAAWDDEATGPQNWRHAGRHEQYSSWLHSLWLLWLWLPFVSRPTLAMESNIGSECETTPLPYSSANLG